MIFLTIFKKFFAENQFSTVTLSEDKLHAKVHFAPNKTQQLELMRIFKVKQHHLYIFFNKLIVLTEISKESSKFIRLNLWKAE